MTRALKVGLFGAALFAAALISPSSAVPITFTYTGAGSGNIGGVSFGLSNFTVTATGDLDELEGFGAPFVIHHESTSLAIEDVGTYLLTTQTATFYRADAGVIGLARADGHYDLYDGTAFIGQNVVGWDMQTSLGPIAGTFSFFDWYAQEAVFTDAGRLIFNDAVVAGTFQASIGAAAAVPESGSTMLFATVGLASALIACRHRNRC